MWEAGGWKTAEAAERARKGWNVPEADGSCKHWGSPQRKLVPLLREMVLLLIFLTYETMGSMMTFLSFLGNKRANLRALCITTRAFYAVLLYQCQTAFFAE